MRRSMRVALLLLGCVGLDAFQLRAVALTEHHHRRACAHNGQAAVRMLDRGPGSEEHEEQTPVGGVEGH